MPIIKSTDMPYFCLGGSVRRQITHCGMARIVVSEVKFSTLVARFCVNMWTEHIPPSYQGFQIFSRGQQRKISVIVVIV